MSLPVTSVANNSPRRVCGKYGWDRRERTDDIKAPDRYEFHQVLAAKAQFLEITGYSG
jgi:hypothetical protein